MDCHQYVISRRVQFVTDEVSQARRLTHLRTLSAVQHCARGHYQPAMDTFLMFNINPALIISLYPAETISGKLHVLRDQWMRLFGGVEDARLEPEVPMVPEGSEGGSKSLKSMAHLGAARKPSLDTLRTVKDDDAASISSTENSAPIMSGEECESVYTYWNWC